VLRRRLVVVLVIAVAMGLLTSYLVYKAANRTAVQQAETEDVVVAKANIAPGEALTPSHITLTPWPKNSLLPGSLRSPKDAEGRIAKSSIVAGEPILDSKLAPAGQGGLMPVLVPNGKRGVSIVVEAATQKSGFVVPNSRVDVVVTMTPQGSSDKRARIVLQDVTVLAADQTVEMKDNKPVTMTTVTLALSPEEAERLALAQNDGRVTLALRNVQDNALVSTPGVNTAQLMGSGAPAPSQAKKSTSAVRSRAKRVAKPKATAPAPTVQPVPVVQPAPPPTHTVSVVRGTTPTDYTFVQDPDHGWKEAPTKKSQ
jgi:pilus assembly protein CpaB